MIKNLVISLALVLAGLGCAVPQGVLPRDVNFVWFNLSTNEIWITDAVGLPNQSWAGRLMPVQREEQLSRAEYTIMETVRIHDQITIKWKENGKEGFSAFARSRSSGDAPPRRCA